MATMKAVGYTQSLPIQEADSLIDIDLPIPVATGRDLLINVKAIAVNPVDCKIRKKIQPDDGHYQVDLLVLGE